MTPSPVDEPEQEQLFGEDLISRRPSLADRFGVPPFSVLDARQGAWQARKRAWIALGIQSELGRGGGVNSQSRMALELAGGFQNHPAHRGMNLTGRAQAEARNRLAITATGNGGMDGEGR